MMFRQRLPLNSYVLSVGISDLTGEMVEANELCDKRLTNMLQGQGVLLASKNQDFVGTWGPVLGRLGAHVIQAGK